MRDALTQILSKIPMVERPRRRVPLRTKLMFTSCILILYFVLCNIPLFGLSPELMDLYGRWRLLFAAQRFSLTAAGIMPIISASIILQILVGPKIMKLDLTEPRNQAFYLNMQKLLVLCLVSFTSFTYVSSFYKPSQGIASQFGVSSQVISFILFIQVLFGGLLIYYMVDAVSKWGLGSGLELFILAEVSQRIITGLINWMPDSSGVAVGVIPGWIETVRRVSERGGSIFPLLHRMLALIITVVILLLLIYLACTCVEISIPDYLRGHGRIRFPIRFVHFTWAIAIPLVFLNLGTMILGLIRILGIMLHAHGGLLYYFEPVYPHDWFPGLASAPPYIPGWQIGVRIVICLLIVSAGSMISGWLWLKLSPGMERGNIRVLIRDSGIPIRGYRRSIKSIRRAMERYTMRITVMSCGLLGALFVIVNALGTVSGAGVGYLILAVSVIYSLYEHSR